MTPTCRLRRSHPTPPPHPYADSDPAAHRCRGVDRRTTAPNPPPTPPLPDPNPWRRSPATSRWRYHPAGSSPPRVRSPPACAGNSPWRPWPNSTPATPTTESACIHGATRCRCVCRARRSVERAHTWVEVAWLMRLGSRWILAVAESGGLIVNGFCGAEMVVGVCVERLVIRVRNPRRERLGAGDPRARPNEQPDLRCGSDLRCYRRCQQAPCRLLDTTTLSAECQ